MRVVGTFKYDAPPETLYALFTNPDALRNATPGLQSLDEVEPDRWEAVAKVGIGGFALHYRGFMVVTDRQPGEGYRIALDFATHNGSVQAEVRLRFSPLDAGQTRLEYESNVEFNGAQKISYAIARGLVDFFLHGMKEYLEKERSRGRL